MRIAVAAVLAASFGVSGHGITVDGIARAANSNSLMSSILGAGQELQTHQVRFGIGVRF